LNLHDLQPQATKAVSGTKDWTQVELVFETEMNESVQINCLFGGWGQSTGKAWFDDISLEFLKAREMVFDPEVEIDAAKTSEPISKYIYGQFIEHLGRCIYGGIWAEMLEDRKFYYPVTDEFQPWRQRPGRPSSSEYPILTGSPWKVIGPADTVQMVKEDTYVGDHTPLVKLSGEGNPAGIEQGSLGLVAGKDYIGRVVLAGDPTAAPIRISLIWGEGASERQAITIARISGEFAKYPVQFKAGAKTDGGRLEIVGLGKGSFRIGTVSLMPTDNIQGMRADTLKLLKELNSPVYRWPGGNFVSGYDWKDGIGDPDRRPPRKNPAWTGVEHNDFGLHEFIAFCRLLDTEPYVTVNTGLGTAKMAAQQVEYCNSSAETPMGKWRAQNGNPQPFKVKWWAVGNEMYGNWQLGNMPLADYVKKHNMVVDAMRAIDPSIVPVAVGNVGRWSEQMMTSCADHMGLISEHFYCQERSGLLAHVQQIPRQVKRIADAHRKYRETVEELKGKDIRIALDEWNYWYGPHVFGELGVRYFLKDALGIAAGLHEYFRNSDIIYMANYAQTVNVIGCIKTSKTEAAFATTGLVLKLYRRQFGEIPVQVGGNLLPLDVSAAWSNDRRTFTIGIVNQSNEALDVPFTIKGVKLSGKGRQWLIAGTEEMAYNEPGQPPKIQIAESAVSEFGNTIKVAPMSVTLYALEVR